MIVKHQITNGHTLESDAGSELYIEVDQTTGEAEIAYKRKDGERQRITTDSLEDFCTMLTEALKVVQHPGKVG